MLRKTLSTPIVIAIVISTCTVSSTEAQFLKYLLRDPADRLLGQWSFTDGGTTTIWQFTTNGTVQVYENGTVTSGTWKVEAKFLSLQTVDVAVTLSNGNGKPRYVQAVFGSKSGTATFSYWEYKTAARTLTLVSAKMPAKSTSYDLSKPATLPK